MKDITAYTKLKIFLKRIEIIETSIRTSNFLEKMKSSKDYFVSLEELKILNALQTLAECFQKEASKKEKKIYSGIFLFWSQKFFLKVKKLEILIPYLETFKDIIDITVINCNLSNFDTCSIVEGVKLYIEEDSDLKRAISIFELFIISEMTQKERNIEIEFQEFSLN
jgi:hypothetical protein